MYNRALSLIEAPICLGSPTRGSEGAFEALLQGGIAACLPAQTEFLPYPLPRSVAEKAEDPALRHLEPVMAVNRGLYEILAARHRAGRFPILIGGDHSVVMASLAALAGKVGADNLALIYIDGHTDINTERSSVTGYIHGMPLAAAMGLCTDALTVGNKINLYGKNTYILGAHSIDPGEYPILEAQGVHLFAPEALEGGGWEKILAGILRETAGKAIHVSFDVDSITGAEFPATGYAMEGGLHFETVAAMLKMLWQLPTLASFDCVEYNPTRDRDGECLKKLLRIFRSFSESG